MVHVTVAMSLSGCHVTSCNVAPLVSVKRLGGVLYLLTWPGHDLAPILVIVALSQALDGGGGWVMLSMVVVEGRSSDVALFEPQLPHLGSQVQGMGYMVL